MRLLGRIWQNWQTFVGDDSDAPWSIHKFTRTDPFYLQFQWTLALKKAIRLENLDMIQWLFAEFQGYTVTTDMVAQAVRQGAIPILQYFLDNGTSYSAPESVNISPAAGGGHRVCWAHSLVDAAKAGKSNTLRWVHDNVEDAHAMMDSVFEEALKSDVTLPPEWGFQPEQESLSFVGRQRLVLYAVEQRRFDILQWTLQQNMLPDAAGLVVKAAENEHFDIVRWLVEGEHPGTTNGGENGFPEAKAETHLLFSLLLSTDTWKLQRTPKRSSQYQNELSSR